MIATRENLNAEDAERKKGNAIGRPKIDDGFKDATARYDAAHTQFIGLKLNTGTDRDILEWLASQPSKQGAIKQAIRFYLSHKDKILDVAMPGAILDYLKE